MDNDYDDGYADGVDSLADEIERLTAEIDKLKAEITARDETIRLQDALIEKARSQLGSFSWSPIDTAKKEVGREILVADKSGDVVIAYWEPCNNVWWSENGGCKFRATHWMPVPEAPKPAVKDDE